MQAKRIIIHIYCYNQQHKFESQVKWLQDINLRKILSSDLHMTKQGSSLHIFLYYCQHTTIVPKDTLEHKFSSKDHHNTVTDMSIHRKLSGCRQNILRDSISHINSYLREIMNLLDISRHMILSNCLPKSGQDIQLHMFGCDLMHTLRVGQGIGKRISLQLDLPMYQPNNVRHNTLSNCLRTNSVNAYSQEHIFELCSDDIDPTKDIVRHIFFMTNMQSIRRGTSRHTCSANNWHNKRGSLDILKRTYLRSCPQGQYSSMSARMSLCCSKQMYWRCSVLHIDMQHSLRKFKLTKDTLKHTQKY